MNGKEHSKPLREGTPAERMSGDRLTEHHDQRVKQIMDLLDSRSPPDSRKATPEEVAAFIENPVTRVEELEQ